MVRSPVRKREEPRSWSHPLVAGNRSVRYNLSPRACSNDPGAGGAQKARPQTTGARTSDYKTIASLSSPGCPRLVSAGLSFPGKTPPGETRLKDSQNP